MGKISRLAALAENIARKLTSSAQAVVLRRKLRSETAFLPTPDQQTDVLLNFPDSPVNMYQVRQWYGPLERLSETHNVAVLCYHPRTAQMVAEESDLKVVLTPNFTDLSEVERTIRPKVILYPNQNYANYRILGLTSAEHVFICHGESDKIYMASNWVKIFNYFFVAGQASKNRLSRHVKNYDVQARTIDIGRPQIDIHHAPPVSKPDSKITVLYAPTWEGGRRSMRYGSVASHGVAMVRAMLSDSRFQVIYRPHPRTGIHLPEFEHANNTIKQLIHDANVSSPEQRHLVDDSAFGWQLEFADVMITDVSAVAYDWLTTAKPLLATRPLEPRAVMPEEGFMSDAPLIASIEAPTIVPIIEALMSSAETKTKLSSWADYYYGERSRGSSLKRFVQAIDRVLAEREEALTTSRAPAQDSAKPNHTNIHCGELSSASVPQPSYLNSAASLRTYYRGTTTKIAHLLAREAGWAITWDKAVSALTRRKADIVASTMAGPRDIGTLLEWLGSLEQINRHSSVAILTGDHRTYKKLKSATGLRVLLGNSATETEQLFTNLEPQLNLQFEQTNLNLRETTHRDVHHVYVGSSHDCEWINNRLRLFDTIIAPDKSSSCRVEQSLIDFPSTITMLIARPDQADDRYQTLSQLIADVNAT